MNVVFYTGDASSRRMIRQYEFDPFRGSKAMDTGVKFHVLLDTPAFAMMDMADLEPIRWAMIAVDEAHRLKNKDSELHLSWARLSSANRLFVTGSPRQNSVADLWALLHFLKPDQVDDHVAFSDNFSFPALGDEERLAELHSTLRPSTIRRQKIYVEKVAPEEDLQRFAGWNDFFATAALSVVVDEELCKISRRHDREGYGSKNNITKPYYGAEKVLQCPFSFRKC
jgi:chromodomain-helicase-DNA-binding protein 1